VSRRSREDVRPPLNPSGTENSESDQGTYGHTIRQLRVCVRVLSAVLLALIARSVINGASLAVVLTEALVAFLLLAAAALWRYARRIETRGRARTTVDRAPRAWRP
jgi:hypothetical protein